MHVLTVTHSYTEAQEEAAVILQETREEEIVVALEAEAEVDQEAEAHAERTGNLDGHHVCHFAIC